MNVVHGSVLYCTVLYYISYRTVPTGISRDAYSGAYEEYEVGQRPMSLRIVLLVQYLIETRSLLVILHVVMINGYQCQQPKKDLPKI